MHCIDLYSKLKDGIGEKELEEALANPDKLTQDSPHYQDFVKLQEVDEKYKLLSQQLEEKVSVLKELKDQLLEKKTEVESLEKVMKQKQKNLIVNDQARLGADHWLHPQTLLEGHNQWFSKNDFRDLSRKMFNAAPSEREMICSEFSARSIVSVIDQLNRITAVDLQAAELISSEERIIKEPISKSENFNNLHPERLVKLLKQSGCVEKIENSYLTSTMYKRFWVY